MARCEINKYISFLARVPFRVRFVEDKVTLRHVFLRVFRLSPVSVIAAMLHAYFRLHVALTKRTSGRSPGIYKESSAVSYEYTRQHWTELLHTVCIAVLSTAAVTGCLDVGKLARR
jgi:Ni/Fe-hydrogenase subunit HybB-like protein